MGKKITDNELEYLQKIFNEILELYTYEPFLKYLDNPHRTEKPITNKIMIEKNLEVFVKIPKEKIESIINNFTKELFSYIIHKYDLNIIDNEKEKKAVKNKIQSDINTIKKYQKFIEHYTNPQKELYIPLLREVFEHNEKIIEQLNTYKISNVAWLGEYVDLTEYLAPHNDTTKNNLKDFFDELKKQYKINAKPLFDII